MRVLAAFFVNVLFNFAIGLLVAKFLGPAEYGRFALALATAMAVQALFSIGFGWARPASIPNGCAARTLPCALPSMSALLW